MEWQYIKYFLKVAEYEHITKASHELNITQPALSRAISKLEEELGVPLFLRDNRRIKLNKYGLMFKEHALVIEKEMQQAKKNISEQLQPDFGEITIGFFHTLGIDKLPSLLASFKKKYPKTIFKLKQANKRSLIHLLYNGEIDFCFTTITGEELGGSYSSYDLWEDQLFLTVSNQHRLAFKDNIHLDDLHAEDFIILKDGYGLRTITNKIFKQLSFKPKVSFEGEEIDTVAGLVSANLGISFLPRLEGNPKINQIKLKAINHNRVVGVIFNERELVSPISKSFLKHVLSTFKVN
ncbi:LysR family transcriptional regulator [Alkalihalobacillus pseudalcaliphilus]|uniref:LysR family transcriptional regulator n=1 Tax=Alkalihalobacillus pseudalcaliphilus TaxID=79884 RepID=UPI00064DACD9|nr:LysR family transcriptional regulator [Alkalihalobacillus pseudalcaliphilus]KMK76530.1 hypothetical protein AB990_15265 [Alkalihalobacillus pseudalcaliphilus]